MSCERQPPCPDCHGPEGSFLQKKCDFCKNLKRELSRKSKLSGKTVRYCTKHPGSRPPLLYSWGKRNPEGKLHWLLSQDDGASRTAAFRKMLEEEDAIANRRGPGLYLCSTLTGSAEYCPDVLTDECVLIEAEIGDVVPCLDIATSEEQESFRRKLKREIDHDFGLAPVLVHFTDYATGHWYVLKSPAGCSFSVFDGTRCEIKRIEDALDLLNRTKRSGAYCTLMRQLAPDVGSRLNKRFGDLLPFHQPLPPAGADGL